MDQSIGIDDTNTFQLKFFTSNLPKHFNSVDRIEPLYNIDDYAKESKNSLIEHLCKNLNIKHITSTAHHHQTVQNVERSHRTFNEQL